MKHVVVVATLSLKDGQNDEVLEALKTLHKATHQEDKGCIQYDLHKDKEKKIPMSLLKHGKVKHF